MKKKPTIFMVQLLIFMTILLVSELVQYLFKPYMPMPTSVVGMILLFLLLCFKVIKLHNVEKVGNFLLDNIGFLFVPSGIALVKNWDLMAQYGLIITILTTITTIILLLGTGWFAQLILGKDSVGKIKELQKQSEALHKDN